MEQPSSTQDRTPEPPLPPALSLAGRMTSVIAAPSEAFDALKNSPPSAANWVVPALLLIVVSWAGLAVLSFQPAIEQQLRATIEQSVEQGLQHANLPADQAEKARDAAVGFSVMAAKAAAVAQPVLVGFVVPFTWGLILWLLGAKAFKGGFPYMKAVEAVGLANVISALGEVVRALLVLILNSIFAAPSLVLLVLKDFDPQNPVHNLLTLFNVMTFWGLVAYSFGLARLSRISLAKAAGCVFGIWFAYRAFFTGLGLISQAIMKHAHAA